jgi:hypothetical protein
LTEHEVNVVIPLGERLQGRCEIPQRPGMTHREQNSH